MIKIVRRIVKHILIRTKIARSAKRVGYSLDAENSVMRRDYSSYDEYVRHQSEKLGRSIDDIVLSDQEYEAIVAERYGVGFTMKGKSILCLGARLGGEVRAFKKLGGLAVGIDIEPGPHNQHVLLGDFHKIEFPDGSFDFAFCNAIDHVFDLTKFVAEVARVLKPKGCLIAELAKVKPGAYEVLDTSNLTPITESILRLFELKTEKKFPIKPITLIGTGF